MLSQHHCRCLSRFEIFMLSFITFIIIQLHLYLLFPVEAKITFRSPCPDIFEFKLSEGERASPWRQNLRWEGIVTVAATTLPVFLKLKLLVPAPLATKYGGRLEVIGRKNVLEDVNSGRLREIKYKLHFPPFVPLPQLLAVEVNSKLICRAIPVFRRIQTFVTLEHSLLPFVSERPHREKSNRDPILDDLGSGNSLLKTMVGDVPHETCGTPIRAEPPSGDVPQGSRRDWPWMVPLFKKTDAGLHFLCSSTLISNLFVVTAAHCVKLQMGANSEEMQLIAFVGRSNIVDDADEHCQPREIHKTFLHPDYDPETVHSDLAVLKLRDAIEFTPYANAACIWSSEEDLNLIVGRRGVVFGWGMDGEGNKMTETPRFAVMPIVSQEECLRSRLEFVFLTTNRTLCAGFRNGTGPCNGDSGGGLLIPRRERDGTIRWFLRGIISLSIKEAERNKCDLYEYTVFTDLAKYSDWLSTFVPVKK